MMDILKRFYHFKRDTFSVNKNAPEKFQGIEGVILNFFRESQGDILMPLPFLPLRTFFAVSCERRRYGF